MIIRKELIKREIAGDTVLVPVGKAIYDSNGLFVLNEVAAFIWERLPAAETEADLCRAILDSYDVSEETAAQDVAEFLQQLRTMGIL